MLYNWSVFTKPWRTQSSEELGELVSGLGFTGVEFPLRPGFQAEPEHAERDLPRLAAVLKRFNVDITSVASVTTEPVFAACEAAGVPVIRIMVKADPSLGWMKSMDARKKELEALLPLCEKYGVSVAVQPHYGFGISSTMELRYLLNDFDPRLIGAAWDSAHSALAGELPEQALDIIWDKLIVVNLKTAFYRRANGPEAEEALYKPYFTTGRNGASSWKTIARVLHERKYEGTVCMPAEYTDEANTLSYIKEDLAYAKSLLETKS